MKNPIQFASLIIIISLLFHQNVQAQNNKPYNPHADANAEISLAIEKANKTDKNVMLIIGGNWCPWCIKLNNYFKENEAVKSFLNSHYEVVKVNYSKEVKNMSIMKRLEFPQRFGFPVLVILNQKGERIHTQNSAFLEENKGYSEKVILRFLKNWSVEALKEENYIK